MKVSLAGVGEMPLRNNGITLKVYSNADEYLGKLFVGKAKIVWCDGRTRKENGKETGWEALIEHFRNLPNNNG